MKSSVDEIRQRFDNDVERFSNLETGQVATVDAALAMELVAQAAAAATPQARRLLDVGCGAGNYTIKALQHLPGLEVTLVDLSRPMLDRAKERLEETTATGVHLIQGDIREIEVGTESHDIILAAAVLHHLRDDSEWESVFSKLFQALTPGGSLWIFDMVESGIPAVQELMWRRYGEYLKSLKGSSYRDHVFGYIEQEDSPRPLMYQLDLMRQVGFEPVDVLHKNACFAAFGGVKPVI